MKKLTLVCFSVAVATLLAGQTVLADIINLSGTTYEIPKGSGNDVASTNTGSFTTSTGTVTFNYDNTQPTGSGVLKPFVRIQGPSDGDVEQGYNTSAVNSTLPFDTKPGIWTHDVLISDLSLNTTDNTYGFLLDINESSGGSKSLISLDGLKLYATDTKADSNATENGENEVQIGNGSNAVTVGDWAGPSGSSLLLWDMDEVTDNWILLDYDRGGGGSGKADMQMVVPESIIAAAENDGYTNFVLWSRFGLNEGAVSGAIADAGYEEWGQQIYFNGGNGGGGTGAAPAPAPLALLGLGAVIIGWRRKQHSR